MSEPPCISLATSKICPMYADTTVRGAGLFNTVEEFDRYVGSRILGDLRKDCPSFTGEGLRYHLSLGCSVIVGISKCAESVPPVCQEVLNASLQSLNTLAGGSCSPPQAIQAHLAVSSAAGATCKPASESESGRCGFVTQEEQKRYCFLTGFVEPCCESFKRPAVKDAIPEEPRKLVSKEDIEDNLKRRYLGTSLFIFATVGTTIGSIILATLVIFFVMKSKIQQDRRPQNATHKIPISKAPTTAGERTSFYF